MNITSKAYEVNFIFWGFLGRNASHTFSILSIIIFTYIFPFVRRFSFKSSFLGEKILKPREETKKRSTMRDT